MESICAVSKMLTPREHATSANKAPIVRAMTALLMIIAILAATLRIATRVTIVGSLSLDDGLIAASAVRTLPPKVHNIMLHIIDVGELGLGYYPVNYRYIRGFGWSWHP